MRRFRSSLTLAAALCALAATAPPTEAAISYKTLFQDPGPSRTPDRSLDAHLIALINATPPGERARFTFRDFNSQPITDALIAAHGRGVDVRAVIDGDERDQPTVQQLVREIGADRVVVCGEEDVINACIADVDRPGLMHNKFSTFSRLADGRGPIVLQTSKNFLEPSQLTYYNDMVEIEGDVPLYDAYNGYFDDLQAQVRSADHYLVEPDTGPNTIFTSPRFQATREVDDTIVDRMNEVDCSEGGSDSGRGLIRVANMAFRSERAVIMRKLAKLHRAGCEIDVIATNLDADIVAGLASAGIRVRPFFLRRLGTLPQVIVHSKFWLVDARSTRTGRRTKLVYAGSSNWRGDQQRSDDLLLRISDDGVYESYAGYWEKIRGRVASDQATPATDTKPPVSVLTQSPPANAAGWNRGDVHLRIAASDGHNVQNASGLRRLRIELSGAQTGSIELTGEQDAHRLAELDITAEGVTTVRYLAEDRFGRLEAVHEDPVRIDRTPPRIAGLPATCVLWPPNGRMVPVADVTASDAGGSGVASLSVAATGGDVAIDGGSIAVRAEKADQGRARTYVLSARATDEAGNVTDGEATCVVPHSQGGSMG